MVITRTRHYEIAQNLHNFHLTPHKIERVTRETHETRKIHAQPSNNANTPYRKHTKLSKPRKHRNNENTPLRNRTKPAQFSLNTTQI